jgi:membrane-associated phospholipid phosphatase
MSANSPYFPIDLTITNALQTLNTPFFSQLMILVSWFGYLPQSAIVSFIIIAAIYFLGFRWEAVASLGIAVIEEVLNTLIKSIIHRPRPAADLVNIVTPLSSYSFPSGHVMYYVAFFGFIWFLIYTLLKNSWIRTVFLFFFGLLILFVGISRIYLGEHWSSDVLGAYLLGTLILIVAIQIYLWGKNRFMTH